MRMKNGTELMSVWCVALLRQHAKDITRTRGKRTIHARVYVGKDVSVTAAATGCSSSQRHANKNLFVRSLTLSWIGPPQQKFPDHEGTRGLLSSFPAKQLSRTRAAFRTEYKLHPRPLRSNMTSDK